MKTHSKAHHGQLLIWARFVFISLIMAIGLSAGTAGAAPTTIVGVPAGYGLGYNDVIGTVGIFNHLMTIGSSKVYVYCLVQANGYQSTGAYHAVGSAAVTNLDAALNIAANSNSIGTPLSTPAEEVVAVQMAIWNETGSFNISQVNNSAIDARANALVAAASSFSPSQVLTTDSFRLTQTSRVGGSIVHFRLIGPGSGGAVVTISIAGKAHAYHLSGAGTLNINVSGRHTVTASYVETVPAGTLMAPSSTSDQPLATADAASITSSASIVTNPLPPRVVTTTTYVHHVYPTTTRPHPTTTTTHPTTTTTRVIIPVPTTTIKKTTVCTNTGLTWKSWQVLLGALILFLLGFVIGSMLRKSERE
jgi:hypothetical protein